MGSVFGKMLFINFNFFVSINNSFLLIALKILLKKMSSYWNALKNVGQKLKVAVTTQIMEPPENDQF